MVSQHLASEYQPTHFIQSNLRQASNNRKIFSLNNITVQPRNNACNASSHGSLVEQLMEMGFARRAIEAAIQTLGLLHIIYYKK